MKNAGGGTYLNELVGRPLDDGANVVDNFYNRTRPTLVYPKRDTHLVPYAEMSLQIFHVDFDMCQVRRVEFDNDGLIDFIYIVDRARHVHEGPFQNSYPISCAP
jgi:hypothetical protein